MTGPDGDALVRVGVLGCGTVGSSFVELLNGRAQAIEDRTGVRLEVARVAVRDMARPRGIELPPGLLTDDASAVASDPDIDVVVEVMGGIEPAHDLVLTAIKAGKPVVTANKELLASRGSEIFAAAETAGVDLLFEAAVGGGIPLMRPLRESLLGETVEAVVGIVNGTTNYILTRMTEAGQAYEEALAEAQALGYAEADPTADVEGYDSAAKLAIIATIAFGAQVSVEDVYCEGISGVTAQDIAYATSQGMVVKLLAVAQHLGGASQPPDGEASVGSTQGSIALRVHPALVPNTHPLASVRESYNAVFVEGAAAGGLMFYGRGAGGGPTASAVLGDVVDAALNLRKGAHASLGTFRRMPLEPIDELRSEHYLVVEAADRPGVLAAIAGVFSAHGVSIASMKQDLPSSSLGATGSAPAQSARIVFVTHLARERDMRATVDDLSRLDVVHQVGSRIRVLADET